MGRSRYYIYVNVLVNVHVPEQLEVFVSGTFTFKCTSMLTWRSARFCVASLSDLPRRISCWKEFAYKDCSHAFQAMPSAPMTPVSGTFTFTCTSTFTGKCVIFHRLTQPAEAIAGRERLLTTKRLNA